MYNRYYYDIPGSCYLFSSSFWFSRFPLVCFLYRLFRFCCAFLRSLVVDSVLFSECYTPPERCLRAYKYVCVFLRCVFPSSLLSISSFSFSSFPYSISIWASIRLILSFYSPWFLLRLVQRSIYTGMFVPTWYLIPGTRYVHTPEYLVHQ